MKKVITYGTFDLLHHGHIRLLERAKALGDYLVVGVTSDTFDRNRGKLNVQQSLIERIKNVTNTGLADQILVEEYEGQKIDDIKRLGIDVFTVGSDWKGHFDYLKEYCDVVYLDRTAGISSTELRTEEHEITIGMVGEQSYLNKFERESHYVNGVTIKGVYATDNTMLNDAVRNLPVQAHSLDELLDNVDAVYILSNPIYHYEQIKRALERHKHVLCESPVALSAAQFSELRQLAEAHHCALVDALRTPHSTAFHRMLLLVKSGILGNVVSVDTVCTSLLNIDGDKEGDMAKNWNSICSWGPTAMLPIFQLLGTDYREKRIVSRIINEKTQFDSFTQISFIYPHAVANIKVGIGAKSEGQMIISGTKGYIWVPAPWWKTDYFEIKYENPNENRRFFYQLDGEGIRAEILNFIRVIQDHDVQPSIDDMVSMGIVKVIEDYYNQVDRVEI
ncbi:MAG: adenylyltransferase/cytidyltransferase family protein [Prevotella sp.]|jgi:choline-phosphate cytidylyltransferase|nr:adenylyltransferase/cytidyltransferase family protein [Prevotella sp.]